MSSSARRTGRRIRRAWRLPPRERLVTLHAALVLVVVEALLRLIRLPRLAALLGVGLAPADAARPAHGRDGPAPAPAPDVDLALRCAGRVARVWPFAAGPCLRESLVAGHLLRRHAPVLRIGVAGDGHTIRAHAWLEVGGRPLGDGDGFVAFGPSLGSGAP